MKIVLAILCLHLFVRCLDQKSTPEDNSYVAAVVEFQLTRNLSIALKEYGNYVKMAAEKDADIVVFPEMTLVRKLEVVRVPIHGLLVRYPIPALHPELYDEPLVAISKAARQHEIYVVINVQEEMNCQDELNEYCPVKKVYRFNTNVVFDRTGAVINRYRKINPFGEATRSPALKPDLGIFSTDFGVTFGHFICFDIMFQVPAVQVVQKHKIQNVIFPTMWFSEMPYLTAVESQQAYAYTMNVNLLAANANNIKVGTAGSGIYSGQYGALVSVMSGVSGTRMLVANVPKIPGKVEERVYPGPIFDNPTDPDDLLLNKDLTLPSRVSKELVPGYQEFTIVDKDVRCKVTADVKLLKEKAHKYRAFVHHGVNTYSKRQIGVAVCSVVACKDDDVKSCPYRFNKNEMNVEFEELQIEMSTLRNSYNDTLQCSNLEYFPVSLRINKFPLDSTNFTYAEATQTKNGHDVIKYTLKAPQNELITFGVWGRIFDKDDSPHQDVTEEDVKTYINIENIIYKESEAIRI